MHILVVEDEQKVAQALKEGLEKEQYDVEMVFNGEDGFFKLNQQNFDLLILDVMLPGRDGFEILQTMRQMVMKIPVLILTAKDAVEDRVEGLDLGADDYLVKPFAFPELSARVRALLRRGRSEQIEILKCADHTYETSTLLLIIVSLLIVSCAQAQPDDIPAVPAHFR